MAAEQATWASWVRHGQGELRVGARSFEVTVLACENPECPCEELTLCFREQAPPARRAAVAFDVYVDLAGDAPAGSKGLGAEADRLAAKVAREVGGLGRATLRDALRDKRMRLRTVDETVMAYARRGETAPWSHVSAGGRPGDKETWGLLDTFDDGARDWDVLDYICANPSCDCEGVKLAFHGLDEEGARAHIGVRVPFGQGPTRFEQPVGVSRSPRRGRSSPPGKRRPSSTAPPSATGTTQ